MSSYVENKYCKNVLKDKTNLPNEIIDLICEYAKETKNDVCKKILWDSVPPHENKILKLYKPVKFHHAYRKYGIHEVLIKAYSLAEAWMLLFDYIGGNKCKSSTHYWELTKLLRKPPDNTEEIIEQYLKKRKLPTNLFEYCSNLSTYCTLVEGGIILSNAR